MGREFYDTQQKKVTITQAVTAFIYPDEQWHELTQVYYKIHSFGHIAINLSNSKSILR